MMQATRAMEVGKVEMHKLALGERLTPVRQWKVRPLRGAVKGATCFLCREPFSDHAENVAEVMMKDGEPTTTICRPCLMHVINETFGVGEYYPG